MSDFKKQKRALVALLTSLPILAMGQSSTGSISVDENTSTQSTEVESTAAPKKNIEKVEVTGSHIKRTEVEGPSPVQIIDNEQLNRSGYNSVSDVLRENTGSVFGSSRETSGSNTAGVATADLRGLGANRTLVLLNGKKIAKDGIGGVVDLNLIPMAAVERIEILKDGASAAYGSDALGGVVNIITKKNFSGVEFKGQQEVTDQEGGNRQTVSGTFGKSFAKGNALGVLQFRKNDEIYSRNRDWAKEGESIASPYGNYKPKGGVWTAGSTCPDTVKRDSLGRCLYNFADFSTELPRLEQFNALFDFNYDLTSNANVYGNIKGTRKEVFYRFAPGVVSDEFKGAGVDSWNLPGHTPGTPVQISYRANGLGTRDTNVEELAYGGTIGTKMFVSDTWEADVSFTGEQIKKKDESVGFADKAKVMELINSGALNLTDPSTAGVISSAAYSPSEVSSSKIALIDSKMSGELFEMPNQAGPVSLAFGAQYTYEKYTDTFDALSTSGGVLGGGAGSNGFGSRQVHSAFSELAIPLHRTLEVQAMGRFDRFSDFGDTVDPKVAVKFKPIDEVMFRTSAGTGFKAPDMTDLYAASSEGYPLFIDEVMCRREGGEYCRPQQWNRTTGGNKGLKEEKSKQLSGGIVIEPNKNFNISADYFYIEMDNVVGLDLDAMTKAEANGVDLASQGIKMQRDPDTGEIVTFDAPILNLSARKVQGIDFGLNANVGKFSFGEEVTYMLKYQEEGFPGAGFEDVLGQNGAPRWKNNVTLGFSPNDNHQISFDISSTGTHLKSVETEGKLKQFHQVDAQYNYNAKWNGTFTLGVKNIFQQEAPLDETNVNDKLNTALYDPIGPRAYVAYKQSF